MKIYIGADHGGFSLKETLKERLSKDEYEVVDLGAKSLDGDDDYVDYGSVLAEELSFDNEAMGILICRNGVGMSIVANRFSGVRCALGFDVSQIERARTDDDVNCLALPADYLEPEFAVKIVKAFLDTKFSGGEKYTRRLTKIDMISSGCCGGGCGGCGC